MGLDMSSLVKGPALDVFARPVDITPVASQPGAGSYRARGYLGTNPLDVQAEDGSVISQQQTYLDVRDREFAIVPRQRDVIDIPADGMTEAAGRFEVVDGESDGGGLTTLILRKLEARRP